MDAHTSKRGVSLALDSIRSWRHFRACATWGRVLALLGCGAIAGAVLLNLTLPVNQTPYDLARRGVLSLLLLALGSRAITCRRDAFVLMLGWYLGACAALPPIWSAFFGNGLGWIAYPVLALALALPAWISPRRYPSLGVVVAAVLAAVPPLGLVGLGNPILAAGALFPGLGWAGIALTLFALALSATRGRAGVLIQIAVFGWGMLTLRVLPPEPPAMSWAATTHFGSSGSRKAGIMYDDIDQVMHFTDQALREGAKLVVLPEGTDPQWGPGEAYYWRNTAALAKRERATVLVGAYTSALFTNNRSDGFVDLASGKLYPANVAVPFGMYAPWRAESFGLRLRGTTTIRTPFGQAAYLVCYEELLPWPLALQMHEHPKLIVSGADQWFAHGWLLRPQERSVALQARLWGLPLLRAVNYASIR